MGLTKRKKCFLTCAKFRDLDNPAHAQSIIRAFALHPSILKYPMILLVDSEVPDHTARMHSRSMIRTFTVRLWNHWVLFARLSLLTITNPNQMCKVLLFACSKMADETNLSYKLPVAERTREV